MGICDGRVCIVTGAGRGIGREYALMLADQGAKVVVNDLGGSRDGAGADEGPAAEVVSEIVARGGEAYANTDNVADFAGSRTLVQQALDSFGRLDVVVNNAGILRDRMVTNMTEAEWDAVIEVHLKGTFGPSHHAAAHWRERAKAGEENDARIINTTSVSGIYGNAGQTNYGAAKAGVAAFSFIASLELARYGVTVNAVAPAALTRMTEDLQMGSVDDAAKDAMSPRWIAPVVTWLASQHSRAVTGRVIEASGQVLAIAEGWHRGPSARPVEDPVAAGEVIESLLADARPPADMNGRDRSLRMTGTADVSLSELARTPIPLDAGAYDIRDAAGTIRGVPHRWRWTVEGLEDLPGAALVALDAIADVLRAAGGVGDDLWALADSVQAQLTELAAIHGPDNTLVATIGEHHPLSIATEECDRLLSAAGRVVAAETGRREIGGLVGIQRSDGGAPKSPAFSAEIGPGGLMGDRQATREHHGRPFQAVSLYSAEVIGSLAAEGHPISAGSVGENLTLSGLDWGSCAPGSVSPWGIASPWCSRSPRGRHRVPPSPGPSATGDSTASTTTSTPVGHGPTPG